MRLRGRLVRAAQASVKAGSEPWFSTGRCTRASKALRSSASAPTIWGFRLRVLSSHQQASRRQWLRFSTPAQCPRIRASHCSGDRSCTAKLLMKYRISVVGRGSFRITVARTATKLRANGKSACNGSACVRSSSRRSRRPWCFSSTAKRGSWSRWTVALFGAGAVGWL